jgi:hypothetical protein
MNRRRSPPRVSLPQAPTSHGEHPLTGCLPLATFARPTFACALAGRARPQRVSRVKPDSTVSGLPACSSFRAFRPLSPAHGTFVTAQFPERQLRLETPERPPPGCPRDVPSRPSKHLESLETPPPGCPRDVFSSSPKLHHHPVAQRVTVPSLSDPKHHPGTQMMFRLGISRPSPDSYPPDDFRRESPRSALLRLPKGRPSRSRRLLTAPPHGCPRDDSVRRRSKSIHPAVARAMISTSSRSRQPPLGFPPGTFDLELHPRPPLLAVARAKIRAHPLPHSFPRGRFDRARPHAVARARIEGARSRAVAYAEDSIAPASSRSYPRKDSNAPVVRPRFFTQLPTQRLGCARSARSYLRRIRAARDRSRGCPRVISSSGHSLVDHLPVARSMICARVAERLR